MKEGREREGGREGEKEKEARSRVGKKMERREGGRDA